MQEAGRELQTESTKLEQQLKQQEDQLKHTTNVDQGQIKQLREIITQKEQ